MTDREARLAKNEALFRGVNERVREVKGELADEGADSRIDFICECGRGDCVGQVRLTLAEYERVRAEPTHFVVVPGHEAADVERIVRDGEGYTVVEKHEEEGDIARASNPARLRGSAAHGRAGSPGRGGDEGDQGDRQEQQRS